MERLDKIISATGKKSRREVKLLVKQGRILVDGVRVNTRYCPTQGQILSVQLSDPERDVVSGLPFDTAGVRTADVTAQRATLQRRATTLTAAEQAEILVKYEGYLDRQKQQIDRFKRNEEQLLPDDIDYLKMDALRIEARQKLNAQRPRSLGQASRIPGVSPGDTAVLMVWLEKWRREHEGDKKA